MEPKLFVLTIVGLVLLAASRALSKDYPRLRTIPVGIRTLITMTIGIATAVVTAMTKGDAAWLAFTQAVTVAGPALLEQISEVVFCGPIEAAAKASKALALAVVVGLAMPTQGCAALKQVSADVNRWTTVAQDFLTDADGKIVQLKRDIQAVLDADPNISPDLREKLTQGLKALDDTLDFARKATSAIGNLTGKDSLAESDLTQVFGGLFDAYESVMSIVNDVNVISGGKLKSARASEPKAVRFVRAHRTYLARAQ